MDNFDDIVGIAIKQLQRLGINTETVDDRNMDDSDDADGEEDKAHVFGKSHLETSKLESNHYKD